MGVSKAADAKGAALASYLLFEAGYTRELMALGYADAMRQSSEICTFFDWTDPSPSAPDTEPAAKPAIDRRLDPLRLRQLKSRPAAFPKVRAGARTGAGELLSRRQCL